MGLSRKAKFKYWSREWIDEVLPFFLKLLPTELLSLSLFFTPSRYSGYSIFEHHDHRTRAQDSTETK
jgi:hypothetical protein